MAVTEMTAAGAAIEAARLGLIGTIAVGILATLGTLAGTLLAPFLIRRAEIKAADARRRRDEITAIIPDLIRKGTIGARPSASLNELADSVEAHARFAVLLRPDEWQMAIIAEQGLLAPQMNNTGLSAAGQVAVLLPMWARGEITSAQAAAMFTNETGIAIERRIAPD
ncbi:hypothetical protein [Microbacterium sp. T32]|uniref:hypothetical protein n=1 Tax=Microbacterium sp. T32 TaxID=1776083 RepID=UPI0007ABBE2F|nr:hypothetical protein [Microbacterium sp. T32]KZE41584.1 hypothetical protein AVW09_03090 [Microbacterium sp. T32]